MLENEYDINIENNTNESKDDIFSGDDEEFDEDHLKRGTEIQAEHKPTYNKIKKYLDFAGELPSEKDLYKSIAKDHMNEPDGVGELYYDEEEGLEDWEEELKDEWKEKQEEDERDSEKNHDDKDDED